MKSQQSHMYNSARNVEIASKLVPIVVSLLEINNIDVP